MHPRRAVRLPAPTHLLLGITIAALSLFTAALFVPGARSIAPWNVIVTGAAQWLPAVIFWLVAVRTRFRRWDVTLVAAAVTSFACGNIYFAIAMDDTGRLPFPSFADVGYLLFYPLMVAALIAVVRRQQRGIAWWVLLESVVAALGTAAILAAVLDPFLSPVATGSDALAAAISVAYPVIDLLIVSMIVGLAASPSLEVGRRWVWLVSGILVITIGDVSFAILENRGVYLAGTPLDATWPLGFTLLAIWALGQTETFTPSRTRIHIASPVPALAVVAGIGVLVTGTMTDVSTIAIALAAVTVGLAAIPVMLRQTAARRLIAGQQEVMRQFEALDRSKSELMSTVNHELRTPLTSILGYVELLRDGEGGKLPQAADEMLSVVENNAERLEQLVDDMLTMSVLDAEPTPASHGRVALAPVLDHVVASLEPFAAARGVDLSVEWNDAVPVIDGDHRQLERALTKVMHNAIKFTPAGGSVGVEVEQAENLAVIRIIDTGIGIPEQDLPQLFGRFFRASNAQAGAVPGTGLGLAIVRGLIRAHGGEISVTSAENIGTTVRIELPATCQRVSA